MKQQALILAFLLVSLTADAQPHPGGRALPEVEYIRRVDSVVNGRNATLLELKQRSDCADKISAWYLDDRLICIHTLRNNGPADAIETNYYVRNDTLVYTRQHLCRTIPGTAGRPEEQTDNVNDDKRPESRTNCLSVSLFFQSGRMVYAIDGEDVFGDQRKMVQEEAEMLICYSWLLNELRKEQ